MVFLYGVYTQVVKGTDCGFVIMGSNRITHTNLEYTSFFVMIMEFRIM